MSDLPLHRTMQDDEIDRLKAQLKETEAKGRVLMDMCRDLRARVSMQAEAMTTIAEALDSAGNLTSEMRDFVVQARSGSAKGWLLRKQAEAVEQCWNMANEASSLEWLTNSLADHQLWLEKRADEIERAGGEK